MQVSSNKKEPLQESTYKELPNTKIFW